ncbi:MAG TPA: radical SAM protein [Longimicrobium sp.]
MRRALIVSFDLIREGEPGTPLSIASLLAKLKSAPGYGTAFVVEHVSINQLALEAEAALDAAETAVVAQGTNSCDTVAISCYIWAEREVSTLIRRLRGRGYRNKIVLGGPQITYASREQLPSLYPEADIFVTGYGEESLHAAILMTRPAGPRVLSQEVTFGELPSPYLTGELPVALGQERVRMETRRGCPFRCAFCAHRDLKKNSVHRHPLERAQAELDFLAARQVRKVNFLDPVFNEGPDYLSVMEHMVATQFEALVTFQSRFELIRNAQGERFLDHAAHLNAHLEFGLQTAAESEGKSINRRNSRDAIQHAMRLMNDRGISYEVSLIYGLPGQTVRSFAESILFLRENECQRITAFPLMLLRGTELFVQKERWGFQEQPAGRFGIPVVYQSNSYTEREWQSMRAIADELMPNERV